MQAPAFSTRGSYRVCAVFLMLMFALAFASAHESRAEAAAKSITLFAAASTTNAITEIVELYKARSEIRVRTVFAASSTLAKQIINGAPADLFLSANERWMMHLIAKGAIEADTRVNVGSNRLVMIVGAGGEAIGRTLPPTIEASLPLGKILGKSRLAMGDPAHVPAGIYAKAAMQSLGLWEENKDKLAFSSNVRIALALVERGEAAAGIVYETDALIVPELTIAGVFPKDSHPPIIYPLAIVTGRRSKAVSDFYGFLLGPEAARIFVRHGFSPSEAPK